MSVPDTHPDDAFGDWLHAECVAAFEPETLLDPTDPVSASWMGDVGRWLWTRGRRYLPLHERRARCWEYLRER